MKWEHKKVVQEINEDITNFEDEKELNKLGQEGWKLISVTRTDTHWFFWLGRECIKSYTEREKNIINFRSK
jgi:hypothetical protein